MRIFLILTLLISIQSFGQNPTNYQYRTVRERLLAMMADSTFHLPRYNGTPSGVRTGSSTHAGALGADTLNNRIYFWSDYVWHRLANYSDLSAYVLYTDTALMLTPYLRGATEGYGIDITGSQHKTWTLDSGTVFPHIRATISSGSGTINSGLTNKPAYYTGATTLDDFAAVDYATSGTHVKIKAQAITDTVLQVTGASSQTAPLQVWENGSHTDLTYIEADGDIVMTTNSGKQLTGTGDEVRIRQTGDALGESGIIVRNRSGSAGGIFYNSALDLVDLGFLVNSGLQFNYRYEQRGSEIIGGNTSGEFQMLRSSTNNIYARFGEVTNALYGLEGADGVLVLAADNSDDGADDWWLKSRASNNDLTFDNNATEILRMISTGGLTMPEIAAPSTPASGYTSIYPKSDGLWYGKDDAGVESRLSNLIKSKGMTLESPGAAESFGMWQTQVAITVSSIKAVVIGSSPSVTINIAFGTDRTSGTNVFSSGTAITNTTTGQTLNSGFNDATIPAGSFIWFTSSAQSGTVTQIEVTINYTED